MLFTAVLLHAGLRAARADQRTLAPPAGGQLPARAPGGQVLPAGPGLPVLPVLGGNRVLYVSAIGSDRSSRSKIGGQFIRSTSASTVTSAAFQVIPSTAADECGTKSQKRFELRGAILFAAVGINA